MKIVYVSGPITGDGSAWARHCNLHKGLEVARDIDALMPGRLGALSPHGNTYHMDGPGISWEQFLQLDLELIRRLDGIVLMPGWLDSPGACKEHDFARSLGKPCFYWPRERPALMRWVEDQEWVERRANYGQNLPPDFPARPSRGATEWDAESPDHPPLTNGEVQFINEALDNTGPVS